ncbi:serine hydrolase domain-containing protein [Diaminobutyricimonas sp. TR449]|uniref:serine hydrolase domain-containing protein n=1 Tax=Diaminobutyricimonas sp. TR449 TaxID=2708076 RepID=UPI00141EC96B|nr:serine hydrolase domain-containing protein [Diaminobutyricimonas sp. TR449]
MTEGWSALASVVRTASGDVLRDGRGTPHRDDPEALRSEHLFDLASLTKAFTAVAVHSAIDDGLLALDQPIAEIVDAAAVRDGVTPHHLLTHTAGLRPSSHIWRSGATGAAALADVLDTPPLAPPGATHDYSCLGFIVLGLALEELFGAPLDDIVLERVAGPIGATTLRWGPVAPELAVATEQQPHRGMLRGDIHDELAASIGRPVGNAGAFGTVDDVVALASAVAERRLPLSERAFTLLTTADASATAAGSLGRQTHGLRVGDPRFMTARRTVGHTGFTGTSFVADTATGAWAVQLTNRVHAGREGTSVDERRPALAAQMSGVSPR